jgi:hypothetical protein
MRKDAEGILDRIIAVVKAELNTKITAINAEKNDSVVLDAIDDMAYAVQELNGTVQNYDPFVLVGIDNIESVGKGPMTSELISLTAVVILADAGEDSEIVRRLLRYNRCLKDCVQNNWSDAHMGTRFEISSLVPIQFKLANSSKLYRAVGIQIKTGIG